MTWTDIIPTEKMAVAGNLAARAEQERQQGAEICPPQDAIFRALDLTSPDTLKVVIIGQDPYHTPGQADGLAFSNPPGNRMQPSLANIMQELGDDLGIPAPQTTDLTPWARQGVLLLNTSLTVYAHRPNSHVAWGWQEFTGAVLEATLRIPHPIVYILWGANARKLLFGLDVAKYPDKQVLMSSHPSPYSASSGSASIPAFFGSRPFSRANGLLIAAGMQPVDWRL